MSLAACDEAFVFGCEGEALVGILHRPPEDALAHHNDTGVVVVVGGPQYRAGSHRQFVHLARALASAGHPVLRFDVRGMGDSTGSQRGFEHVTADIGAAIDALQLRQPQVRRVILWGLCDGASAALLYLHHRGDVRVTGLCLLNPWVRSPASLARTHVRHYYTRRLREPEFWNKLLRGGIAVRALRDLAGSLRLAGRATPSPDNGTFQSRMLRAWQRFDGPVLLVLSGDDYTASEFADFVRAQAEWRGVTESDRVLRNELEHADHTFSSAQSRSAVEALTQAWMAASCASAAAVESGAGSRRATV